MADDTPDGGPANPEIPTEGHTPEPGTGGHVESKLADLESRVARIESRPAVPEGFTVRATDPAPKAVPTDDPGFIDQRRQLVGVGIPGHVADDFHRKGVPLAGVLKVVQEFRDVPETATIITRLLSHLTERAGATTNP